MTQIQSRLLLIVSLTLVGGGLCRWLEEGAPWTSSTSQLSDRESRREPLDVRELIAAQDSRGFSLNTASQDRGEIELAGGTLSDESAGTSTPVWLTGEIEF